MNTNNSLTTQHETKQLWIGLVEARPLDGCDVLDDAKGAFVNIITWAADADEYRHNAELVLGDLRLFVVDITRAEPIELRRRREGDFEEEIEDMISRAHDNPNAIIYGTFHLWEKDDA
jgi:hypothetical protein